MMLQYKLAKFSFLYSDVLTVLSPCQLDLNIQLFLVVYVEAFFVLVCSKTNYHPAFFVITEELGLSLKIMFDFDKLLNYYYSIFLSFIFEFYYRKIFKWRSRWRLRRLHGWNWSLWLLCNWRYKELSVSRDQKVMKLLSKKSARKLASKSYL